MDVHVLFQTFESTHREHENSLKLSAEVTGKTSDRQMRFSKE
ncbi:MAG: hypothetical protein R2741_09375 [Methanolobus sp.]